MAGRAPVRCDCGASLYIEQVATDDGSRAGRFLLCLHSHMPYVLSHGKSPHGTDWLMESAAECYLPILDALLRLEQEGIHPRWTINMTPILAEQLADELGLQEYLPLRS